ncbi:hypothetical protein [Tistrella mobilis]|uniref:hypothetical protein n=1 Tax=Tistrella mobilis TaxID=171437 RepID=UPI0035579C6D
MDAPTASAAPAATSPSAATAATSPFDRAPERDLVNPIPLTADDIAGFRDKGYIALRGLLTPDCTDALRAEALKSVVAARDIGATYGDTFRRLTYALGETDTFKAVYTARAFRKVLGTLTGTRLIMTEAQGFELNSERNGFPWHYGSLSFRFIRPQDMGYSIWIPLDPIDPTGQGGGMAYIPETLFSARGNFQMSSLLSARLIAGESIADISAGLAQVYNENSILMTGLFERHREEDHFAVGDAFVFNKYVWHRSSPLRPGPTGAPHRAAGSPAGRRRAFPSGSRCVSVSMAWSIPLAAVPRATRRPDPRAAGRAGVGAVRACPGDTHGAPGRAGPTAGAKPPLSGTPL